MSRRVLIVGWYGTETVGDKAILAGILNDYLDRDPSTEITISSLYPFITRQTIRELGIRANVVPARGIQFVRACLTHDDVVMGGGPLMEIIDLSVPLWAFLLAKLARKKRILWGCGIGPLWSPRFEKVVESIVRLATDVRVRDHASLDWVVQRTGRTDAVCIGDPARSYVMRRKDELNPRPTEAPVLACFLRQWFHEYQGTLTNEEFFSIRERFEENLAAVIRHVHCEQGLTPTFYPMHNFSVGGDDRDFNRRFVRRYLSDLPVKVEERPSTVDSILTAMLEADRCICMRFHSVLFAHTLGCEFLAIDYTRGGKIPNFLRDNGSIERCAELTTLASLSTGEAVDWLSGPLLTGSPVPVDIAPDAACRAA